MRRFVRSHPVLCYYLLALAICSAVIVANSIYGVWWQGRTGHRFSFNEVLWALLKQFGHGRMYANIISIAWAGTREPVYFGVFLFGGAPTISAITISAVGWGRAGLARLVSRLKPWASKEFRRDALIIYAALAVLFFGVSLAHLAIIWNYKGPAEALATARVWGLPPWLLPLPFLIGGFIDEGASLEELGWRGFALPVMLEKIRTPLVAALLLGVLWWAWHFPREVPDIVAGVVNWSSFIPGQAVFLVLVVTMNVVMTFLFHRTGSILPTILVHGWGNFITKAVGVWDIEHVDDRFWIFLVAAVLLVAITGPQLGRRGYVAKRQSTGFGPELPAAAAA
ncbi:MAG TPA: CPBP family glutamic-type intramembrane protease [Caulobacteraceae bacterium]|nr:CPBP family glutamic-type intramembrane protease [Caulobacteraceae bacterium]